MKNKILSLVAFSLLGLGSAFAQNDNGLIGKARGAANDCLNNFNGNQWNVGVGVYSVEACLGGGEIKEVLFYVLPVLPPCDPMLDFCPTPLPAIVAVVRFDCDGRIISNSCF